MVSRVKETRGALGAGDAELRYWRTRAEELERAVALLRARLLFLADWLPTKYLPLLVGDTDSLDAHAVSAEMLEELEETSQPIASDVAPEIRRVWKRLAARGSG